MSLLYNVKICISIELFLILWLCSCIIQIKKMELHSNPFLIWMNSLSCLQNKNKASKKTFFLIKLLLKHFMKPMWPSLSHSADRNKSSDKTLALPHISNVYLSTIIYRTCMFPFPLTIKTYLASFKHCLSDFCFCFNMTKCWKGQTTFLQRAMLNPDVLAS